MKGAIGVFDSGVGGLTVLKALQESLPQENFIYFGDNLRVPYGVRPQEQIIEFSLEIVDFLLKQQVKSLVIACNTIDSAAYQAISSRVKLPVLGIIDSGVDLALATSENKKIGLIATNGTIQSQVYQTRIRELGDYQVFSQAVPEFVTMVEANETQGLDRILEARLGPLKEAGIDTLILGCTHFPVLAREISHYMGPGVKLVDPAEKLSQTMADKIPVEALVADGEKMGQTQYYISGDPESFQEVAHNILNKRLEKIERVSL